MGRVAAAWLVGWVPAVVMAMAEAEDMRVG